MTDFVSDALLRVPRTISSTVNTGIDFFAPGYKTAVEQGDAGGALSALGKTARDITFEEMPIIESAGHSIPAYLAAGEGVPQHVAAKSGALGPLLRGLVGRTALPAALLYPSDTGFDFYGTPIPENMREDEWYDMQWNLRAADGMNEAWRKIWQEIDQMPDDVQGAPEALRYLTDRYRDEQYRVGRGILNELGKRPVTVPIR